MAVHQVKMSSKKSKLRWFAADIDFKLLHTRITHVKTNV